MERWDLGPGPSNGVLIVSDDERVAALVEMAVRPALEPEIIITNSSTRRSGRSAGGKYDLIILALSAYDSEPVVALARAALTLEIGRVPLLIISDRAFRSDPATRIRHMPFPFTVGQLYGQVQSILQEEYALPNI